MAVNKASIAGDSRCKLAKGEHSGDGREEMHLFQTPLQYPTREDYVPSWQQHLLGGPSTPIGLQLLVTTEILA